MPVGSLPGPEPARLSGWPASTAAGATDSASPSLNRPRFYAHFLCWEGWRDAEQVRREHQGQSGAAGP